MAKKVPTCSGGVNSDAFMPLVGFISEDGRVELKDLLDTYLSGDTCLK